MARVYWFALFLASAIAAHAGYLLSYPQQNFERKIANALSTTASNTFEILPAQIISDIFPAYAPHDVVAICRYDVATGNVEITAKLPRGYWTLSIFNQKGRQLYSMTDTQAGDSSFKVELSLAPDIVEQVLSVVNDQETTNEITDASWRVMASEPKGVAVIWVPVADPIFRAATLTAISQSRCGAKG